MSPPPTNASGKNVDQAQNYLDRYVKNLFNLNIHWSDPFMFSIELGDSFNKFRQQISSKSGSL
jgi:hypothetical protein